MGSYVNQALRGNNNRAPIDDDDDDVIPHMNGTRPLRSTTVPSR